MEDFNRYISGLMGRSSRSIIKDARSAAAFGIGYEHGGN